MRLPWGEAFSIECSLFLCYYSGIEQRVSLSEAKPCSIIVGGRKVLRMTSRIPVLLMLLAAYSAAGFAQRTTPSITIETRHILIPGVFEPPEMKGPAKVSPTPSTVDKAFWDVLRQAGNKGFTEANLPVLDKFIQDYPSYADAYYERANAEACGSKSSNLLKAKTDLETALSHKSNGTIAFEEKDVLSLLARIEAANGDPTAALALLEKAMRMDLDSADNIFNIQGTSPETTSDFCTWNLTDLRRLASSSSKDWRPLALEGLYYQFFTTFNESYYPQATAAFRKAALVNGKTPIVPYLQGELHVKSAFWTKKAWASDAARDDIYRASLPFFTRTIQLDPSFEQAYAARAEVYLQLKQDTLAIKDYDKVLSFQPNNSSAHSGRGLANADVGRYYAAIVDFGDAISAMQEGDVYLPDDYENRGNAYIKVRDYRRAIDDYSSAIELRIETQLILWSLTQFRDLYPEYAVVSDGVLLQKLNRRFAPQYKADAFKKLMTQDNGKWDVSLLNALYEKRGDAYLSVGDYRRGILDFQRIFVGMPDYGESTERWRPIGAFGHGEKFYLDVKASAPLSDRSPRIWVKSVGAKQSEVMAFELDCSSRRLKVASNVVYDVNNNIVRGSDADEGWSDVAPDTLGEQLWNGVCQSKP